MSTMSMIRTSFLMVGFCAVALVEAMNGETQPASADRKAPEKKPPRKFTISPGTTRISRPVDDDGYIDYTAAFNKELSKGITPTSNANVLLLKAFGPRPDGWEMPSEYCKLMGIEPP